ncbi:MAG: hypothetical protein JWQ23_1518 [Herminiimonas sp.]|nr:hypothetical protein [Herminiimonas sp.]
MRTVWGKLYPDAAGWIAAVWPMFGGGGMFCGGGVAGSAAISEVRGRNSFAVARKPGAGALK